MKKKNVEELPADYDLLQDIQPQGGITFKEPRYIQTGNGYEMCIHVYEFPTKLKTYWMAKLCNIKGAITTVDISTDDILEVKKNINKSISEQNSRFYTAKDYQEVQDAVRRKKEMETLYDEIESMGEVIKLLHVRIYVVDRVLSRLEERVDGIIRELELSDKYKATIFLNEGKQEWKSMYKNYTAQSQDSFFVPGQEITSTGLAGGNPFHFSDLEDPYGIFLGSTPCGGNVFFDEFTKTRTRRYYNGLGVGTMGAGKSTLLKKLFESRAIRGDFLRTFDITGEFLQVTEEFGGKYIQCDGSNGKILNPLEILRSGESETINFTRHLSKVTTMYQFLNSDADRDEIQDLQELLTDLYDKFGLKPNIHDRKISGLSAKQYPIFTDLLQHIVDKMGDIKKNNGTTMEEVLMKKQLLGLERIRKSVASLVNTYGELFNKHTNFDNIVDEQIVTFDLSKLKDMRPEIFDAVVFNMISLCWENCVTNGTIMKEKYDKKQISFEDVIRFLIIFDESHRCINTQKIHALIQIIVYLREARKFFGGIFLASQSVRDFAPEGSNTEAINQLKILFELTQYKFIFQQDSNVLPIIDKVFENTLTVTQRNKIPRLEQGETILSISSDRTIEFKVYLSPEEEKIFAGGA